MRMSVTGQERARVHGLLQCGWYLCSAPAAILDAFLCLEEKGIVKPGESKKGLEMGILGPAHRLLTRGKTQHKPETNLASVAAEGTWRDPFPAPEHAANTAGSRTWSVRVILSRCS